MLETLITMTETLIWDCKSILSNVMLETLIFTIMIGIIHSCVIIIYVQNNICLLIH